MADIDEDFGKELADAFALDMEDHGKSVDPDPAAPETPPADPAKPGETPPAPNPAEEPKKDDPANPEDPNAKPKEGEPSPADPAKPAEGDGAAPKDPETPPTPNEPEEPKPLSRQDVTDVIRQMRNEERISSTQLDTATKDVMDAYYPDGLSNVLIDQSTGKELKTPQDVVDASNGELSMEAAAQWLMNEQYKLDQSIEKIRGDAKAVAETTVTFRNNSMAALEKYEPLFKAYPSLQAKVFDKMMKFVKADQQKNVILSAPDPMEFYDDYLEPYQMAYEHATNKPATQAVTGAADTTTPPAPKPGAADRLDEGGDGGASPVDDPNDFAQQVNKELAKGF